MTTRSAHIEQRDCRRSPSPHRVAQRLAVDALSGALRRSDVQRLVEIADGDIEALEAAAREVTSRYDDAAAIDAQKLLRRAALHALSAKSATHQHSHGNVTYPPLLRLS